MFTGIVEGTGTVESVEERGGGVRVALALGPLAEGVKVGDSIALNGCCLTVTTIADDVATFDMIPETLDRTSFRGLAAGRLLNVERAMRLGDRIDGHLVQGHVDGVAKVTSRVREGGEGGQVRFDFEGPRALTDDMVMKGSVCIEGVSLTLIAVGDGTFAVAIIPHTLEVTTFKGLQPGDLVNIETDVVGKWIRKQAAPYLEALQSAARSEAT